MKAMQTTFISPTDSLSPRIKISCDGESMTYAWQSGLTIQENHHCAAVSFALSRDWLLGGLEVVTGWLSEGTYVHTFGPSREGSDCAMCGAYAPTADGMICDIGSGKTSMRAFICSDCVHDNDMRTNVDFGNAEQDRDIAIVALRLMLDKYGQEGDESFVAKQVLGFLEEKNDWLDEDGARDLELALVEVLDGMDCDDMLDRLLDRLGFSEVPSHPCDGCGVPVREDEYLGYDKPDGETEYKCENCFGEKYSGIPEEERQWFPDGDDGCRLFKAAPDMLAALEAVIAFEAFCAPLNKIANASTVFADCRDAIAKAKGGE